MPFRFDNKKVFLTYSQVGDRSLDSIFDHLLAIPNGDHGIILPEYVVVSRERHVDGGFHFHAVIVFQRRFQSRNARVFDFDGIHPNIGGIRGGTELRNKITYTKKDGDFKEHGVDPLAGPVHKQQKWLDLIDNSAGPSDFMAQAKTVAPRDFILQNDKFEAFANKYYNEPGEYEPSYTEFQNVPGDLGDWVHDVLNQVSLSDV